MCNPCKQRWQNFLNQEAMKKDKQVQPVEKTVETKAVEVFSKPDINKVIEDRRKAVANNTIVNK